MPISPARSLQTRRGNLRLAGERRDWFKDAFRRLPRCLVAPHVLNLQSITALLSIRVIGHWPEGFETDPRRRQGDLPDRYHVMKLLLCLELPTLRDLHTIDGLLTEKHRLFFTRIQEFLGVSASILAYVSNTADGDFWVRDDECNINGRIIPCAEYAQVLNDLRGHGAEPKGIKHINASLSDELHYWTREYLARKFSVIDIDALIKPVLSQDRSVLLEFKATSDPQWKPYSNDMPNYKMLQSLTDVAGASWAVVQYDPNQHLRAKVYCIEEVSRHRVAGHFKAIQTQSREDTVALVQQAIDRVSAGQPLDDWIAVEHIL